MVYKFLILSDEVDHFAREIEIDSEATFLELNDAILDSVGFAKDQLTSFFICEDNWEKKTEVTLMDMETGYDEDSWVMGETRLSELLEEEKQRMLFVFDNMTLGEIAVNLEHWYNIRIRIESDVDPSVRISFTLRPETLDEMLRIIENLTHYHCLQIDKHHISIRK